MNYIILLPFSTSTLQDILTDLNAEGEPLPIRPVNEEWMGHKVFYIFTIKSYYGVLILLPMKHPNIITNILNFSNRVWWMLLNIFTKS